MPGGIEMTNRETVAMLLDRLGKPWSLVRQVEDRPGHDRRYAMDGSKLAALGWEPRDDVRGRPGPRRSTGIVANEAWWRATRSGDWDAYYERQYGRRLATARRPRRRSSGPTTRLTDARRRHRRHRPPRQRAGRGPRRRAVHRPGRADRLDPRRLRPRRSRAASAALLDRDRPEVVVHCAAWTDVDGCARDPELAIRRNGDRDRRPGRRLRRAAASTCSSCRPTRCSTARGPTGAATRPTTPVSPANPYGASKAAGEAIAARRLPATRRGSLGHRPDGLAVRPARAATSRARSLEAARPRRGRRRAAARRRRRVGHADLRRGRRRRDRRAAGRGRRRRHRITSSTAGVASRADWARDVVARLGVEVADRGGPAAAPGSAPRRRPRWAVLAPTPAAVGRADPAVDAGDGRLRPDPAPRARRAERR